VKKEKSVRRRESKTDQVAKSWQVFIGSLPPLSFLSRSLVPLTIGRSLCFIRKLP
jgi:hypothetical protein